MGNHEPTYRVKGLSANGDLLLVNISDGTNAVGITENGELKVLVSGDISIGDVSVDNVQLIDADGNKLLYTATGEIQVYAADGKIATLGSVDDTVTASSVIGLLKTLIAKDFATETTLATMATEAKAEAIRALLETISALDFASETTLSEAATSLAFIDSVDFATQTTLATLATEAKLEAVRVLLNTISGLDFASETTLDAIKDTDGIKKITDKVSTLVADGDNTALGTTTDADTVTTVIGLLKKLQSVLEGGIGVTESSPLTTIAATIADGSDVALGTTTDADTADTAIGILKALKGKDFATQTTLAAALTELTAIKDTDGIKKIVDALPAGTNEIGEVVISGDETLPSSAPVTGIKTLIPGVAAEIFAGVSKKANRVAMMIRNLSEYAEGLRLRFGESSITDEKGFILEPQSVVVLEFNPKVETAIYAIPETNTLQVEVYEV